ncbi:MAG: Hpt domain-containing protein, partial [Ramlibacter sp.]
DRLRCEAAGMDDYLTKPLQVAALALTLEKWVGTQDAAPEDESALPKPESGPASTAPAPPELIDFSRLQEFKEYDDENLTMTREVIELLQADAPARLAALDGAVAAGDADGLGKAAHALKGASSNVGATALQQACASLEADASGGMPLDAAQRVAELRDLWEKTSAALVGWA